RPARAAYASIRSRLSRLNMPRNSRMGTTIQHRRMTTPTASTERVIQSGIPFSCRSVALVGRCTHCADDKTAVHDTASREREIKIWNDIRADVARRGAVIVDDEVSLAVFAGSCQACMLRSR